MTKKSWRRQLPNSLNRAAVAVVLAVKEVAVALVDREVAVVPVVAVALADLAAASVVKVAEADLAAVQAVLHHSVPSSTTTNSL